MSELSSPQNLEEVCAYLELCVEEAKDKAWGDGISFALCFIKKLLPSAQPNRGIGKWVDDGDPLTFICDQCGYRVARYNNTNFCPNCGADMRVNRMSNFSSSKISNSSDCISRQEAINELEELNVISFYELNEHSREAYCEMKQMLKKLPPT